MTYQWQFTDKPVGSTAAFNNSQIMTPEFVADKAGSYTIQLKVSDGIVVSEPHAITITATEGHADLPPDPGDAGKQTLLSIDSDVDGVRDDIQRHIWATYPGDGNLNVRKALTEIAKMFQEILWEALDPANSYNNAVDLGLHSEYLAFLTDEHFRFSATLKAEILNTMDRAIVYHTYDQSLEGSLFYSRPIELWSSSCAFVIE